MRCVCLCVVLCVSGLACTVGDGLPVDAAPLPPTLSVEDFALPEGDFGDTDMVLTVTLSPPADVPVTVNYSLVGVTAEADVDFVPASGTLFLAAGETSAEITVSAHGDGLYELDEILQIELSDPIGALLGTPHVTGTITNDEQLPTIAIGDGVTPDNEQGPGAMSAIGFFVTLSGPSALPVLVDYTTADDTATAGDYFAQTGTFEIPAGETQLVAFISAVGDDVCEGNERFTVTLTNPRNVALGDASGNMTILEDDSCLIWLRQLHGADTEGDSGTKQLTYVAKLLGVNGPVTPATPLTVNYATRDSTATAADGDYAPASGTLTIMPGEYEAEFTVLVNGDTTVESDEAFAIDLSGAVGGTIFGATSSGLISNDDSALPRITVANVSANESAAMLDFNLVLSPASGQTVTVQCATAVPERFGATPDVDYDTISCGATFTPGATSRTISIPLNEDTLDEESETLQLVLSNPTNAILGTVVATGTIVDNDATPTMSVADVSAAEGDAVTFTVSLSAPSGQTTRAQFMTVPVTAGSADYPAQSGTVFIPAGSPSTTVTIPTIEDSLDEENETFDLQLSAPVNATLGDFNARATINDEDNQPDMKWNTVTDAYETQQGQRGTVSVGLFLNQASGKTVSVTVSTLEPEFGTIATENEDYDKTTSTVTFAPGETAKTFTVSVTGDLTPEPDERLEFSMSNGVNTSIDTSTKRAHIQNDDLPPPVFDFSNASNFENLPGGLLFTFNITGPLHLGAECKYETRDDGARASSDYEERKGTISAPGINLPIVVNVLPDFDNEPNEQVKIYCTRLRNVARGRVGIGIIKNDDQ